MRHRLQTAAGKKLYKLRQQTVEPVFGIVKSALRFRQFLLRGLEKVSTEWTPTTRLPVFTTSCTIDPPGPHPHLLPAV